jgi:hypothetical protein
MSDFLKRFGEGIGPAFADLERRARETLDLTAKVRLLVAEEEKEHVLSATYAEDTLVITTDSAVWATRLRYDQERLLEELHKQGERQASKLRVKVGARSA